MKRWEFNPPRRRRPVLMQCSSDVVWVLRAQVSGASSNPRQDAKVLADALDLADFQCRASRKLGQLRQMEHAPARIADQAGSKVDQQLVHHTRLEKRAVQLRSRLDVDLVEFPPREL